MKRRRFLQLAGASSLGWLMGPAPDREPMTLFLCGDVMTGRGIDQVLPHPGDPRLHESWVKSARDYVALAERENGPIPRPVDFPYVWGDALAVLERFAPEARIINLETAVTGRGEPWPGKGIHYRMHPNNVGCLTAADVHCCVLANNHVLDWGRGGLEDTLTTLHGAGLRTAGAGRDLDEAAAPAVLPVPGGGRVIVFGFGHPGSGIPPAWAAAEKRMGVNLVDDFSERTLDRVTARLRALKKAGDVVVASIHWGGNWGYRVPDAQRSFARGLIERAGVDVVHGHSSHHPRGVEIHEGCPILYGCGDLINDYEGIRGYEKFRGDLSLMYFPRLDRETGRLVALEMVPMRMRRFRLQRASEADARWLADTLDRESARFGSRVRLGAKGTLVVPGQRGRPIGTR